MKIPAAKAAVDKEWEKLEKISAWKPDKSQKQARSDRWSKDVGRKSSFCIIDGHVIWKMLSWRQSTKNTKVELFSEVML